MEAAEIETLVGELEVRVDRLRSLYDQYFMGIEKLEPLVVKRDVERRIDALRHEQIRNSGTRFRFNMITQRYTTLLTLWMRTARQIELGTYKRHVLRAKARFGVNPANEKVLAPEPAAAPPLPDGIPAPEHEVPQDVAADRAAAELADEILGDMSASNPERFAGVVKLDLDDFADPFEELDPFPKAPAKPPPKIRPRAAAPPPEPPSADPHDTERRIPVAPRVVAAKRSPAPEAAPTSLRPAGPSIAPRIQLRGASASAAPSAPLSAAPRAQASQAPVPRVQVSQAPPPKPIAAAAPPSPPPPRLAPPKPPPVASTQPASPRIGDLSNERFGQIYSQYVDTRRKQNEPTGAITRDALAKQLGESMERLRQRHPGRAIDFEVTVKDGKTVLRPVVK